MIVELKVSFYGHRVLNDCNNIDIVQLVTSTCKEFCLIKSRTVFQSCRMGAEATLAVLEAKKYTPPSVVCLCGNTIVKKPLMECVEKVGYHDHNRRIHKIFKGVFYICSKAFYRFSYRGLKIVCM